MLDSHRLAPHPELTLILWGAGGAGARGKMRQKQKHMEQDEGLADLGTKAAQQAQGEGSGQEAASLPLTLPIPLAGPRHPSGHFPNSSEDKKQGWGGREVVISTETFEGREGKAS